MLQPYRDQFNSKYTSAGYTDLMARMNHATRATIDFRVAETPCFFPRTLMNQLANTGATLTHQLLDNPAYFQATEQAIPAQYRVANDNPIPNFMTVDFGLIRNPDGSLQPKLVEMQAFPSIFGYQDILSRQYIETYGLQPDLEWYLGGHNEQTYWALLRKVILGKHDPENVVLAEIDPDHQKTLPDFHVYEDKFGIATVDIAKLRKQGNRLYYQRDGREIPIHRIYNRAIVDELERKAIRLPFDHRDDLNVEWAGHPNWYFRISKFAIPWLRHPTVPPAVFLNDWYAGKGRELLPEDREHWVFKPLYSFAGKGVQFAPTDAELTAIPPVQRHNFLLQQRVRFEPVISLVRLGRGLMMGVDHNRDRQWVGGSAALMPSR